MQDTTDVAIVGAGASGLLVAGALADAGLGAQVALIDSRPVDGGLAYAEAGVQHLLNVPADRMGADPQRPTGFLDWARKHHDPDLTGAEFLPRRLYGDYLRSLVSGRGPQRIVDRVVAIRRRGFRWELVFEGRAPLPAASVVLALGNPPSSPLGQAAPGSGSRVVERPFDPHALAAIAPTDTVLVVGSGLTAVDVVLELDRMGHRGKIRLVSRSGLLPSSHCGEGRCPYHSIGGGTDIRPVSPHYHRTLESGSVAQVLRALRIEMELRSDQCWQSSLDTLMRHELAGLWMRWSDADRRRFAGRLAGRYDRMRHRMAPEVAARIEALLRSGQVSLERGHVGRVVETPEGPVAVPTAGCATGPVDWVVNAKGPDLRTAAFGEVVDGLVRARCARPGWGGLGVDVDPDGRVIETSGLAARNLYALGPVCRGARWETTAMAEVRQQASRLAAVIAGDAPSSAHHASSPGTRVASAPHRPDRRPVHPSAER